MHQLHTAVAILLTALTPFTTTSCDPATGASTLTGTLIVEAIAPACSVEGDCSDSRIRVSGHGFRPGSTLKLMLPGGQVDGLRERTVIDRVRVDSAGRLVAGEAQFGCAVVARPGEARSQVVLAADDPSAGVRRAFTFMPTKLVVCLPPFVRSAVTQPCGQELRPTLTADRRTVGVHWDNRDAGFDRFQIRYGAMDSDRWTETRDYGGDVSYVPINGLEAGTSYEFELLACRTRFLAPSSCTGWTPVGTAAVG